MMMVMWKSNIDPMLISLLSYEGFALNRIIYALVNSNDRAAYTPAPRGACALFSLRRENHIHEYYAKWNFIHDVEDIYFILPVYICDEKLTSYLEQFTSKKYLDFDPTNFVQTILNRLYIKLH